MLMSPLLGQPAAGTPVANESKFPISLDGSRCLNDNMLPCLFVFVLKRGMTHKAFGRSPKTIYMM